MVMLFKVFLQVSRSERVFSKGVQDQKEFLARGFKIRKSF